MGWTQTDEEEFPDQPIAAHAIVLPEQQIEGDSPNRDLEENGVITDLLSTLVPGGDRAPVERTVRRVARTAQQLYEHPGDAAHGFADLTGLGALSDRLAAHPGGVSRTTGQAYPPSRQDYTSMRAESRAASDQAADRSPSGYRLGEGAGLAAMLGLGGGGVVEEGASLATRLLGHAGMGAVTGATDAAIRSEEPTLGGVAADSLTGGALGGTVGTLFGLGGEAVDAVRRAIGSRGALAPEHYLASVGGERQLSPSRLHEWGVTPEARQRSERTLREMGIGTSPLSTPQSIRDDAARAAAESYAQSQGIRQRFDEAGGLVPLDEAVGTIRGQARELTMSPTMRDAGIPDRLAQTADEWERQPEIMRALGVEMPVTTPAAHPPLANRHGMGIREYEDSLRTLGDRLTWRAGDRVPVPESVGRDTYSRLRDVGDAAVAAHPALGPEEAARFARERLRTQAATRAERHAQAAIDRGAGARSGGLTEQASGQVGATIGASAGGPGGAALGAIAGRGISRALRPTELARRAWVSDLARRISSGGALPPAMSQWSRILEQAAARGALPAVHALLLRSDPAYSAAVDGEMGAHAAPSALRPLSDEPAPTERAFDPSELEERPFDPSELE